MAINIQIKNECRIVPIRFERATKGEPNDKYPDIDDRGHAHAIPTVNGLAASDEIGSAVLAMGVNKEVEINMIREDIDNNAPLFVTSSDSSVLSILLPKERTKCDAKQTCKLTLKTNNIDGSTPKLVFVDVRFGKANGPIIAKLATYIFPTLVVNVQPYYVTIDDRAGNSGTYPKLNFESTMQKAKAIWSHYGIELAFTKLKNIHATLNKKNYMELAEINKLYKTDWTSNHINIYFVQELEGQNTLSYGFTPQNYAGYAFPIDDDNALPLTHPGVFVAMKSGVLDRSDDTQSCAHSIAHEIGHFFTLFASNLSTSSPESVSEQSDTWSTRLLMSNQNQITRSHAPQEGENWPDFNEFGYGSTSKAPHSGCMVSLKNIHTSEIAGADGQCSVARNHISKGSNTLYQ
ncbi:MAG: hypothetical protein ACI92O_000400 [Colwellia sp.]|jgi:hypothetical protein